MTDDPISDAVRAALAATGGHDATTEVRDLITAHLTGEAVADRTHDATPVSPDVRVAALNSEHLKAALLSALNDSSGGAA